MELMAWVSQKWNGREKRIKGCRSCGLCCKSFGGTLKASPSDIARWQRMGRDDLLAQTTELGWLWRDPETGNRGGACPYLKKTDDDRMICAIHDVKPDICRDYPTVHHWKRCVRGISFD